MILKELIETENRFYEDLLMVRKVFMQGLANIVGTEGIEKIFLNWDQLIKISKRLHTDMLKHSPGICYLRPITFNLQAKFLSAELIYWKRLFNFVRVNRLQ